MTLPSSAHSTVPLPVAELCAIPATVPLLFPPHATCERLDQAFSSLHAKGLCGKHGAVMAGKDMDGMTVKEMKEASFRYSQ